MALANQHFQVKLYPTALASDLLFYEVADEVIPGNKKKEYGTPHPDPVQYPHHVLVFISNRKEDGKQQWWYAANRANEDLYNWQINQGQELIRAYLVPRHLYFARLKTEADAVVPPVENEFIVPIVPTLDVRFPKFGFADDTVVEAPEELKSLYVVIKRRYAEPVTEEISYNDTYGFRVKTTVTLVPAWWDETNIPPNELGLIHELRPENIFHSRMITRNVVPESPGWTLEDYLKPVGIRTDIPDLPRELIAAKVVWNTSFSIGAQDYYFYKSIIGSSFTLGKSTNDTASSAAGLNPEIQLTYRDVQASNLPATEYQMFIAGPPTEAAVLARLTEILGQPVYSWPIFHPVSSTITTTGQNVRVSVNVSLGLEGVISDNKLTSYEYDKGYSDEYGISLSNGSVQITPCIHGNIAITDAAPRSQTVSALGHLSIYNSLVGSAEVSHTKTGTAHGVVSPTTLSATGTNSTIPSSGLYVIAIRPGPMFMGYTYVEAVVVDANQLA